MLFFSCQKEENREEPLTKIALRSAANEVLLHSGDSSSVIKPIKKVVKHTYLIEFESAFQIKPDSLVSIFQKNIKKAKLSEEYQFEVLNCEANEVEYSFQMSRNEFQTFVPCSGREMEKKCYLFKFKYLEFEESESIYSIWVYISIALLNILLIAGIRNKRRKNSKKNESEKAIKIGQYQFNHHSHQLIFEKDIINLSKKEVELLLLLVKHQNEVVKREYLVQKVWEEQGVVVGRSLDTYISKLRKKLSKDNTIQITNLHGIGYKLEIDQKS